MQPGHTHSLLPIWAVYTHTGDVLARCTCIKCDCLTLCTSISFKHIPRQAVAFQQDFTCALNRPTAVVQTRLRLSLCMLMLDVSFWHCTRQSAQKTTSTICVRHIVLVQVTQPEVSKSPFVYLLDMFNSAELPTCAGTPSTFVRVLHLIQVLMASVLLQVTTCTPYQDRLYWLNMPIFSQ